MALPLYLDEGIYIFWAKLFSLDPSFAYTPLTDGKAPLFMWLTGSFNQYFNDFLLTGRLISTFSGGITVLSWMIILQKITSRKMAFLFWLLFLVTPYAFLIERMAFVDSLLTALISLGTMSLVITFKKINSLKKWWLAVIGGFAAGTSFGLAYLTKTSTRAYLVVILIIGVLWLVKSLTQKKLAQTLLIIIVIGVMFAVYNELVTDFRIGSQRNWAMIEQKEAELTYTLPQIFHTFFVSSKFTLVYQDSLPFLVSYLSVYLGVLFIPFLLGSVWVFRNRRDLVWLFIYLLIGLVGTFFSARMMSSRYFYPLVPPFLALAGFGMNQLWDKASSGKIIFGIILGVLAVKSLFFLISPLNAFYSYDDQGFFVVGVTAPGLAEIKQELKNNPQESIVGVSGIWGIPDGVTTELPQVEVVGLTNWLSDDHVDLGKVASSPKPNKYLYLTLDEKNALPILDHFYSYTIIYQFSRPYSHKKVYFLKLGEPKPVPGLVS